MPNIHMETPNRSFSSYWACADNRRASENKRQQNLDVMHSQVLSICNETAGEGRDTTEEREREIDTGQ